VDGTARVHRLRKTGKRLRISRCAVSESNAIIFSRHDARMNAAIDQVCGGMRAHRLQAVVPEGVSQHAHRPVRGRRAGLTVSCNMNREIDALRAVVFSTISAPL